MDKRKLLSAEELAAFSAQLALTVKTGIPLSESVMILKEDAETDSARKLMGDVLEKLELGESLASALNSTGMFPSYMTQMIEIGETSGRLDQVLDSLESHYKRDDNLSKSVRSAILYPSIMLCILLAVVLVLVIKVLPIFNEVFNSLGGEMSQLAIGAMNLGNTISTYSVVFICIIAAIALVIIVMRFTESGRRKIRSLGQKMFKKLSGKMASGKFASAMALMLASGLDVDKSVELTVPLMDNPIMKAKVVRLQKMLEEGEGFSTSVQKVGIFSGMQSRMLALGFKSGNLDTVMDQIADGYEEEVDKRLDTLISIIEPTMVAILCVLVGLILLSAMLPLLGVMTSIV